MIHWRVNHYSALVKEEQGKYLLVDPALGGSVGQVAAIPVRMRVGSPFPWALAWAEQAGLFTKTSISSFEHSPPIQTETLPQSTECLDTLGRTFYGGSLNVELTPDQRAFAQRAIESGRFSREDEAVQEALRLWEERERRRLEILAALDEVEASLARGEGITITEESMKALAEETKQRLRRRIAAEHSAT